MSEQQRTDQQQVPEPPQESPLRTERGGTRIEDSVVSKIAGIAAQEVDGVRMGGGTSQAIGGILSSVTGGSSSGSQTRGVSVEVGEVETAVDLTMTVAYGMAIPQIAEAVRRNVISRVENLVGLNVTEVNISVNDVFFPEQEQEQERQRELERQQSQTGEQEQRVR